MTAWPTPRQLAALIVDNAMPPDPFDDGALPYIAPPDGLDVIDGTDVQKGNADIQRSESANSPMENK